MMTTVTPRSPIRILVLAASVRAASLNARLAALAAEAVERNGGVAELTPMGQFGVPGYDGDLEEAEGIPPGADRFRQCLELADGFIIASPEYNASVPGVLKNLIDWTSRHRPQPCNERHGLLLSASPSMTGGNRGLWALRVPLEHLGARVYPDMFSLPQAHRGIGSDGRIAEPEVQARFESNIVNFLNLVEAAKHYPCVKQAWVEYLGEKPDPAIDRVEISAAAG
jgi:chromate reductase, NAD(P)H dehydrogenase (quinone)